MRTKRMEKPYFMNRFARIGLILMLTMGFSLFMSSGWYGPAKAEAAVAALDAWTEAYFGNPAAASGTVTSNNFTISATGSNKVLMAGICWEFGTAGVVTVTPGTLQVRLDNASGATFTQIGLTSVAAAEHCYLGYLPEASFTSGTHAIYVNWASTGGTNASGLTIMAGTYEGVHQTATIASPVAINNANTATITLGGTGVGYAADSVTVFVAANGGTGLTTVAKTAPNFTQQLVGDTTLHSPFIADAVNATSGTYPSTDTLTFTGATARARAAVVAGGLNPAPTCSDTNGSAVSITNPTNASTVGGSVSITANLTNAVTAEYSIAGGAWTPIATAWDTLSTHPGSSTAPVSGVTVAVRAIEDECGGYVTHQVTVTVDNTVPAVLPSTISDCAGCHQYPPYSAGFADGTARNNPEGQFPGSHNSHVVTNSIECVGCHTVPAGITSAYFNHRNGNINFQANINGGTYSKGTSTPQSNTFTGGTCNTTTCHGAASPTWGNNTAYDTCVKCHGVATSADAQVTADMNRAAPGYTAAAAPTGPGRDTGGATVATDAEVGAHDTHLRALSNYSSTIACTDCHSNADIANASFTNHMDGSGSLNWSGMSTTNGATPGFTSPNCTNTYCHFGKSIGLYSPATANASVAWTNTAYLTGTPSLAGDCGKCHASPPATTGSHAGVNNINQCNGCHNHVSTAGAFTNPAIHVDGKVDSQMECILCHAAVVNSPIASGLGGPATRPDVVTPFNTTASRHIRSRGGSVTNNDCGVCHMEGNAADGTVNSAYHKNGYIELRDPDLGTTIKGVTHSGNNSTPGVYSSTGTDARPFQFSRNLNSATIEADTAAIMVNQCLKCHDAGGAGSALAIVPGGSAGKPFAGTVAANPSGNVLNVAAQFASTNRSFHPVLVKQNSGYTNTGGTRMLAPWNGVTKSASTTIYGPLMTCWDCHAPNNTGAVTITTSGVHGGAVNGTDAVPLRGNVYVNGTTAQTNLCIRCHVVSGGTTNHGTGSAITSSTNSGMTYFQNRCYFCHGTLSTRPVRPIPSGDAHGFNARGNSFSAPTAFPAVNNGYAFLRNEGWYANAYTQSIRMIGATSYTPTCGGMGTGGGCSRGSMGGYTPGGVY